MSLPFVPFYPSDWLAGTRGLTAAETGVYITLVAMMYEREAPLDMPADRLARLCGCTVKAFCAARDTLLTEGKLILRDGGLWNARVEKECAARKNRSEKAQQSAEYRWQKGKQKQGKTDANASPEQCLADANHNHISDTSVSDYPAKRAKRGSRLPETWTLPRAWGEWAMAEGWPEPVIRAEADKFKDYWIARAGRDATKADWLATWRNWMRNCKAQTTQPKGTQNERRAFEQTIATVAARLSEGTATLDHSSRDPFAVRPRRDPDPDEYSVVPLFRS